MTRMDEQLSAYLDGALSSAERARLEARLASDPALRERLEALRRTVALLRAMPLVPTPRNFLLTPAMVAPARPRPAPRPWLIPALSFSTVVSAALCVIALVVLLMSPSRAVPLAATVPAQPDVGVALQGGAATEALDEPAQEAVPSLGGATETAPALAWELLPTATVTESERSLGLSPTAPFPPATEIYSTVAGTIPPGGIGGGGGELPPAALPAPSTATPQLTDVMTAPALLAQELPTQERPAEEPAFQEPRSDGQATREPSQPGYPSPVWWLLVVGLGLITLGLATATVMAWRRGRGDAETR